MRIVQIVVHQNPNGVVSLLALLENGRVAIMSRNDLDHMEESDWVLLPDFPKSLFD